MSDAEIEAISRRSEYKMSQGLYREAIELRLTAIKMLEGTLGKKHPRTAHAYHDLGATCLQLGEQHLDQGHHDEATRYLMHADTLSQNPVEDPLQNRSRLLLRANLLTNYAKLRTCQGKHRQALNYAKKYLELVLRLNLLLDLPQGYINVCTVLSAVGHHDEALAHAFLALQHLNRVVHAIEHPQQTTPETIALKMRRADDAGDLVAAYKYFEMSLCLDPNSTSMESMLRSFSPKGMNRTQTHTEWYEGLTLLLRSLHGSHRCPALQFIGATMLTGPSGGDASFLPTKEMRCKWGGMLSLVYHSIGVQQEHLGQSVECVKTYRVAHATAVQYLGTAHELTRRCAETLKKAQHDVARRAALEALKAAPSLRQDAQTKSRVKANLTALNNSTIHGRLHNTTASSLQKPQTAPQKMRPPANLPSLSEEKFRPPATSQASTRPMWNAWHSSKDGPPRHMVLAQERQELREKLRLPQSRELLRSRCEALSMTPQGLDLPDVDPTNPHCSTILDGDSAINALLDETDWSKTRPVTRQLDSRGPMQGGAKTKQCTRGVSVSPPPSHKAPLKGPWGRHGKPLLFPLDEVDFDNLDEDIPLNAPEDVWNAHMHDVDNRSTLTHVQRTRAIQRAHDRWARNAIEAVRDVEKEMEEADVAFLRETYNLPLKVRHQRQNTDKGKRIFNDFERFKSGELEQARKLGESLNLNVKTHF